MYEDKWQFTGYFAETIPNRQSFFRIFNISDGFDDWVAELLEEPDFEALGPWSESE